MLENKKITVEVEALKVGTTEILICDYNYLDRNEIVKVNVVEENQNYNYNFYDVHIILILRTSENFKI